MKLSLFFIFLNLFTPLLSAHETTNPCTSIKEGKTRLACYDSLFNLTESSEQKSPIQQRVTQESFAKYNRFSITPHRPNYFLPASYNAKSNFRTYGDAEPLFDKSEAKFQLSLKSPLATNLWQKSSIWLAYSQVSYWQIYADDALSAPFRETNHEPELIWELPLGSRVFGVNLVNFNLSFNHQSNGRSGQLSRSWNRIAGELIFQRDQWVFSTKTWKRLSESSSSDDNPNIEDYMGRVALGVAYKLGEHTIAVGHKNALGHRKRSGTELNWTFPLTDRFKGFVQLYSGYGENLIDSKNYTNRFGIGIALTDWL